MARSWLVLALLFAATSLADAAPRLSSAGPHGYGCLPPPQVFLGVAWLPIIAFLFATAIDRRWRIRRTRGEVISLLHADDVARIVARNELLKSALAVAAVIMLRDRDHEILAFTIAVVHAERLSHRATRRAPQAAEQRA